MPVFSHLETQSILSDHLTREQMAEVHQKSVVCQDTSERCFDNFRKEETRGT